MKASRLITLIALICLAWATPALADTFTLSVPANTDVVMGNPQSVVPVTVRNNGPSRDIRSITFNIDPTKYSFSSATVPPSGWCVNSVSAASINFELVQPGGSCTNGSTTNRIDPLESVVFNITVIPVASASDSTDTFSSVAINSQSGFTMSGAMPTWTRRSLDASLSAAPPSIGTGTVSVTMQVTNRSTASKTGLVSVPDPPAASSPIVTPIGGPFYATALLASGLTGSAATVNATSTADFPSSGTITIDSEEICYTGKTASSFTGAARGCNGTTASDHLSGAVAYGMDPFSIAPGETKAVTWTYSADSGGSVYFSGRASDAGATAMSQAVVSNTILIGNFTAALVLSPSSVINGQNVTVEMTVTNNGNSALFNISPSVLSGCAGGAIETIVSGPSPSLIPSLSKGSTGVFSWTYSVSGSVGQAYCLSGSSSANGPVITNSTTSNSGRISAYSVTTAPSVVTSGASNVPITWALYNGGGCDIRTVSIDIPNTSWICSSVTPPAGWQAACDQTVITFTSTRRQYELPPGSNTPFGMTFSSVETVTGEKVASFPVTVTPRGCGSEPVTIGSYITVTAESLAVTHSPAGPIYADGSSYYTLTATLASVAGTPVAGKTITFSTTSGTLSSLTAVTGASGQATVRLASPVSTVNTAATVTADYLGAQGSDTVDFLGWNKANIQYWGSFSPVSVSCGSAYTFTMQLRNISATTSMTLGTASYFSFNDASSGGSSVFQAYLDSPVTIAPGATRQASFGSATSSGGGGGAVIPAGFLAGSYEPLSNSTPPPASGLFLTDGGANNQYRGVSDSVTTGGGCGAVRVRIIEWHEMR